MKKLLALMILGIFMVFGNVIAAPQPGVCYFGDADGNCVIEFFDLEQAKKAVLISGADYSGVIPSSSDVQDLNGNGVIDLSDLNLLKDLMLLSVSGIDGAPTKIVVVQAPTQLDITSFRINNEELKYVPITVKVTDADGTPRAGIGVLFSIDESSTSETELIGRDPIDGNNIVTISGSVFELTNTINEGGEATVYIETTEVIGTLIIKTFIPGDKSKGISDIYGEDIVINIVDDGSGTIINNAPVFNAIEPYTGASGVSIQRTISATDADGDALTYSLVSGPGSFDPATQIYSWTPSTGDKTGTVTSYTVMFRVDDDKSSVEASMPITLINNIPVIFDIDDIVIDENNLISVTPIISDTDNDPLTVSYSTPLNSNGQWQTDYNSAGVYTITIYASDGINTASKTFNVNVNDIVQSSGRDSPSEDGFSNEGNSHHDYVNLKPATPAIPTESPAIPAAPAELEFKSEESSTNIDSDLITGAAISNLVKENPITTALASIVVLSLMGYGIYWFRE